MRDEFTQPGDHHHLIVGIDYGTTYSGVGFALSSSDPEFHEIQAVEKWPSVNGVRREDKVPSQIAYEGLNSSTSISKTTWGYKIEPYAARCAWMKLHLDNRAIPSEYDDPELQAEIRNAATNFPDGRTAQDVTADYFKELYNYTMGELNRTFGRELMAMTEIKFWFSMPAIWSDEAQVRTREAALTAKFGTRLGDEICMIKEPEAAALAILSRTVAKWKDRVQPGDGVMVVDCGGGTVDLTTYSVIQFEPKVILDEICAGIGAKLGATCMERNLRKLMNTHFGEAFNHIQEKKIGVGSKFMEDFEWNKRAFVGDATESLKPMNLFLDGVPESERYRPQGGKVFLNKQDMEKIFDPVINAILQLVEQQMQSAKSVKITDLVLVGGFGESPYLKKKLREWCKNESIRLREPGNSWNAVAKGAVLRGLGQASVEKRICRRHYGVEFGKPYNEGMNEPDMYDPFEDQWYSSGYMKWYIQKGEEISDEMIKSNPFFQIWTSDSEEFTATIYYSELDQAPIMAEDYGVQTIKTCISVDLKNVDMTKFQSIGVGRARKTKLLYTIEVVLGQRQGTILFRVRMNENVIGQADIQFSEERAF